MGSSKILGGCEVRSQEFVPVQSCHISCQLAMSQSESAYSAIADWHWTTSNTPEVAIWAPYRDVGTSQRRSGDVRTWGHVGKIGPWIRACVNPYMRTSWPFCRNTPPCQYDVKVRLHSAYKVRNLGRFVGYCVFALSEKCSAARQYTC